MDGSSQSDPLFLPMLAAMICGAVAARVARRWEDAYDNSVPLQARRLIGCLALPFTVVGLLITVGLVELGAIVPAIMLYGADSAIFFWGGRQLFRILLGRSPRLRG
jgi:hypothetical protein